MNLFYSEDITNNEIILSEEESIHCCKVLRKRKGEEVFVTDGKGNFYVTEITAIENKDKKTILKIKSKKELKPINGYLHVAMSILKSSERFDWFVEKACEMGISKITPIICERTEKKSINIERLKRISISACKQSFNCFFPEIEDTKFFNDFISNLSEKTINFIPTCNPNLEKVNINSFLGNEVIFIIGPEGDFTEREIELAIKKNIFPISFGFQRLRSETAALYSVFLYNSKNNVI